MIKTICIVVKDNKISEQGYKNLVESSSKVQNDFEIKRWDAITPDNVDDFINGAGIRWNYPWQGSYYDESTQLLKSAYNTKNPKARIACAASHYCLWSECAMNDVTTLILEHDAIFINRVDFNPEDTNADIIGINYPIGATRKANVFHSKVQESDNQFQLVPIIDDDKIPQGLAGNSAYIIKPAGARRLLNLVETHGLWPNDAIMCRQLMPKLGVTKTYYTKVQGLQSTTSS